MKIFLINPYCLEERLTDYDIKVVPIGLYYIGAVLRESGHECHILNWYDINKRPHEMREAFLQHRPDIIGISIMHANRWGGIEIARLAKELLPDTLVVFGGPGATFLWRHLMDNFPEIDLIIRGEGEQTFSELVQATEDGQKDLGHIKGLVFRNHSKVICNYRRDFITDINSLPNPAHHFTFQHVVSSRGCPWNCTFCGSPAFWKRRVRFHSPEYFVDQLELLYRKGVDFFYVSDDTFTVRGERVIQICKEIIRRRLAITWVAISRVNCIKPDILYWMRRAGCVQISFGVESGSKKIRAIYNKQIKDEQVERAFKLCTSYGILPRAYFIYGAPGENRKTIRASINLMERIKPLSAIFYILDLFPGTALYNSWRKAAGVTDDIWLQRIEDIMYFETDPNLRQEDVLRFGEQLRQAWHQGLSRYARQIKPVDIEELYPFHADFLSRLGMTFAFGDYASNPAIPEKEATAEFLFSKALEYHPDSKAFLGLGVLLQRKRDFAGSVRILEQGASHFPADVQIHTCMGISLMNMNRLDEALETFLKFQQDPQCLGHAAELSRVLGKHELHAQIAKRLRKLSHQ